MRECLQSQIPSVILHHNLLCHSLLGCCSLDDCCAMIAVCADSHRAVASRFADKCAACGVELNSDIVVCHDSHRASIDSDVDVSGLVCHSVADACADILQYKK